MTGDDEVRAAVSVALDDVDETNEAAQKRAVMMLLDVFLDLRRDVATIAEHVRVSQSIP